MEIKDIFIGLNGDDFINNCSTIRIRTKDKDFYYKLLGDHSIIPWGGTKDKPEEFIDVLNKITERSIEGYRLALIDINKLYSSE